MTYQDKSVTTFMYADDTTIYCIGDSVDEVIVKLNMTLADLSTWCKQNSLIPHPKKCQGMILKRKKITGPLPSLVLNGSTINWVPHSRLLGITVDDKLTWTKHLPDLKKVFVNTLSLLKRSRFLPRSMVLDPYNKVNNLYNLRTTYLGVCVWGEGGEGEGGGLCK